MDKKYLDILRWLSALSVIIVHVAMKTNNDVLHYLFIWGVPIFVMISGSLFLDPSKDISIKTIVTKYAAHIVFTVIAAGTVLNIIDSIFINNAINGEVIANSFIKSLTGQTPQHFWYLYMILGIYLIIPMIKAFIKSADDQLIKYTLLAMFIAISIVPFIKQLFNINIIFYLPITSIYLVYLLLGYILHHKQYIKISKIQAGIVAILMALIIIFTKIYNWNIGVSYNSPIIVILASCLFIIAKGISVQIASKYRHLCFMIYIIHPTVISLIKSDNEIFMIAITVIISLVISIFYNAIIVFKGKPQTAPILHKTTN